MYVVSLFMLELLYESTELHASLKIVPSIFYADRLAFISQQIL